MTSSKDLTGKKFGLLTVTKNIDARHSGKYAIGIYNENCDAGTVLFDEHDQYCIERCLSILENVKNNL